MRSTPEARGPGTPPRRAILAAFLAVLALVGCTTGDGADSRPTPATPPSASVATAAASQAGVSGTVRLYTTVQQPTVDAVTAALTDVHPGITLETFRAPTGEVSARIAAEEREGRIRADVLWLTDPFSIEGYASRGLLREWQPDGAAALDPAYTAATYWGTRVLNMVIVAGADADPAPPGWASLADEAFRDAVALPNPAFAGSAFGALGYFAGDPSFGLDYYRSLKDNGATQVQTPDEVTTGVAEGRFAAGITLDFSARSAVEKGSPVQLIWPEEGSIALFGPAAVVEATEDAGAAEAFVEFLLSEPGQAAIAGTGWEPVLEGVGGPAPEGEQLMPDWPSVFGRQGELLDEYQAIFGS